MGKKMGISTSSACGLIVLHTLILLGVQPVVDSTDNRIVGGRPAEEGEFPYQVSLRRSYNDKHFCGGSLITENHVLTAAHCMYYQWGGILPPIVVSVVAGQLNVTIKNDTVFRNVSEIIVHPKYNKTSMEYDVAVIKLSDSMPITHLISLIPLAQKDIDHKTCMVSGWGVQEFTSNEISESLLATEVTRISSDRCNEMYGNGTIMESMLCAHDEEGEHDACQGDSGGPLVCSGVLIGVISTGEGCANKLYPGIYANVTYLYDWIYENVHLTNESERGSETEIGTVSTGNSTVNDNENNQGQDDEQDKSEANTEQNKPNKVTTSKHLNITNEREYNISLGGLSGESLIKEDSNNTVHLVNNFNLIPDEHNGSNSKCVFRSIGIMLISVYWIVFNL